MDDNRVSIPSGFLETAVNYYAVGATTAVGDSYGPVQTTGALQTDSFTPTDVTNIVETT